MTNVSPGNSTNFGNSHVSNSMLTVGTSITTSSPFHYIGNSVLEIPADGKLNVNGKLVIKGEDIDERLTRIENMLHIPQRDVIMEQKYNKLKKLWKEYNETLAAIKTWETINESK